MKKPLIISFFMKKHWRLDGLDDNPDTEKKVFMGKMSELVRKAIDCRIK